METGVYDVCECHRIEAEDWDGYYTYSVRLQEWKVLGYINTHNIRFGIQKHTNKQNRRPP